MSPDTHPSIIEKNQTHEISVSSDRIMSHFLRLGEPVQDVMRYTVIPTNRPQAPLYTDGFYPINIGSLEDPLILELRHEPISLHVHDLKPDYPYTSEDDRVRIGLLMTNELYPHYLQLIGREMLRRVDERGIQFDVAIGPESLGSKLSNAIAEAAFDTSGGERRPFATSLPKGKVKVNEDGSFVVGPPKEWIRQQDGIEVSSGTSNARALQKLFLDSRIGSVIREKKLNVLLVDDARLTQGTITSSLALFDQLGIHVTGIATVLNEGDPVDSIKDIPFVYLNKSPLFALERGGVRPIPGTYNGLSNFYVRQ